MLSEGEIPSIFEPNGCNHRIFTLKVREIHRIIHDLELSELCIEFGFEGFHHCFIPRERIGEFTPPIGESKDKILMFEELRESFEK